MLVRWGRVGGMMEPPSWISSCDPEATDRGCPTEGEGCREVGGLRRVRGRLWMGQGSWPPAAPHPTPCHQGAGAACLHLSLVGLVWTG